MDLLFDETARRDKHAQAENWVAGDIKFLPKGMLTPAAINVFKESVVIFPEEAGGEPTLITIKNKAIADSFRAQFEVLWNQQAVVITGTEGPKKVIEAATNCKTGILAMGVEQDKWIKAIPKTMDKYYTMRKTAMK